jgi:hypothetical protein
LIDETPPAVFPAKLLSSPTSAWLEAGLGLCALTLPPLLAIVPHGAAPLAGFAGLCAAGLVAANPPYRFAALRYGRTSRRPPGVGSAVGHMVNRSGT